MTPLPPPGPRLRAALALIAAGAVALPTAVVLTAPRIAPVRAARPPARPPVVPPTAVPPVEPVAFVDLPPDEARAFNAGVPFARGPNPAARPFRLGGTPADRARATDCLATAVLYEAGADPAGQRAVAQVVLNRVRHPAFPDTVCGVVFEGQERRTGCQFSFTCDGALTRWSPPEALWTDARSIATAALSGAVYRPVGTATHYHTDWVVPYWQSSLDKIAKVGSHLFFRWTGWWGTPAAFTRRAAATEPAIPAIAAFSDAHRTAAALADAGTALADAATLAAGDPRPLASDPDTFLVTLPPGLAPDAWPALAARACAERARCRFSAWDAAARTPAATPLTPDQVAATSFSYIRDRASGLERTLWNCRTVHRANPRECMRQQVLLTALPVPVPVPASAATSAAAKSGEPAVLDGVRRTPVKPATATPPPSSSSSSSPPSPSPQRKLGSPATERAPPPLSVTPAFAGVTERGGGGEGCGKTPDLTPPGTSPPAAP